MNRYRTDEELEEIVRRFLQQLGLESKIRPDIMTILVKVKREFPGFNYKRMPDSQMQNEEAQWNSDTLAVRESVFMAMQRDEPRARMTLAHELSHFLLSHHGIRNRSVSPKTYELKARNIRAQETEAKRCAAIILAPESVSVREPKYGRTY